jgi:hypothetical protein
VGRTSVEAVDEDPVALSVRRRSRRHAGGRGGAGARGVHPATIGEAPAVDPVVVGEAIDEDPVVDPMAVREVVSNDPTVDLMAAGEVTEV